MLPCGLSVVSVFVESPLQRPLRGEDGADEGYQLQEKYDRARVSHHARPFAQNEQHGYDRDGHKYAAQDEPDLPAGFVGEGPGVLVFHGHGGPVTIGTVDLAGRPAELGSGVGSGELPVDGSTPEISVAGPGLNAGNKRTYTPVDLIDTTQVESGSSIEREMLSSGVSIYEH